MGRRDQGETELGLTLEDLFEETVDITTEYLGKPLTFAWCPGRYTPALEERIESKTHAGEDESELDDIARARVLSDQDWATREVLVEVLVSWSLVDRDGAPVAIDAETFKRLPKAFLQFVFGELARDSAPKDPTDPDSEASSS